MSHPFFPIDIFCWAAATSKMTCWTPAAPPPSLALQACGELSAVLKEHNAHFIINYQSFQTPLIPKKNMALLLLI